MRKYILGVIAILAIAGAVAINMSINSQSSNVSLFSLANVEVLADVIVEVTIKSGDTCNNGAYNKKTNSLTVSCDTPCKMSYNAATSTNICP
jgi:hypothetical protein